ncbi:MAG TPA: DsrE family protein [Acidocella sp.]|nr:DsrE family protein [Acidocella sp.]HQU05438.1 DsrE family protein [Acidocella sp.]
MSMLDNYDFNKPAFKNSMPFATTHAVIQVSEDDPARWNLVLNNAQNMLDFMGASKIQIVIVAYGPGLKMLLAGSPVAGRIQSLDQEGVEFDACHNTMLAMEKATGQMPVIVPPAVIVPAGVIRIMQLEAHGFSYLKP